MKSISLLLLSLCLIQTPLHAQVAAAARAGGELVETILRTASTGAAETTARELAEFGGRKAVEEMLEAAGREGGEAMVRQVVTQVEKHGVLALRALKGAPAPVLKALDGVPAELAENALRGLAHEPALMQQMAREFGKDALEVAARHPGLAGKLGSNLGAEGLEMATKLTTQEATILARHADDIAKLAPAERGAVMKFLQESPGKALAWLEKHPRILTAGAVTAAVVAAREEIFGTAGQPGFLERVGGALYRMVESPVRIVLTAVLGLAIAWLAWKGWHIFRKPRAGVR